MCFLQPEYPNAKGQHSDVKKHEKLWILCLLSIYWILENWSNHQDRHKPCKTGWSQNYQSTMCTYECTNLLQNTKKNTIMYIFSLKTNNDVANKNKLYYVLRSKGITHPLHIFNTKKEKTQTDATPIGLGEPLPIIVHLSLMSIDSSVASPLVLEPMIGCACLLCVTLHTSLLIA